jgi:ABC-type sulfate transport system permease component
VALLFWGAISALINLLIGQIYWHVALSGHYHESLGHSILTTFVEMLLYLASAYVLAWWLYGAKLPVSPDGAESLPAGREI